MKKLMLTFSLFILFIPGFQNYSNAQSEPVLYFCEHYGDDGEINVSDRYTTGYLTVVVKCDYELNLKDVSIQFDKYNFRTAKFEYYKKFSYSVNPEMSYIYFSKNSESDLKFEEPGFYRVFLLDESGKTVASALVEIID